MPVLFVRSASLPLGGGAIIGFLPGILLLVLAFDRAGGHQGFQAYFPASGLKEGQEVAIPAFQQGISDIRVGAGLLDLQYGFTTEGIAISVQLAQGHQLAGISDHPFLCRSLEAIYWVCSSEAFFRRYRPRYLRYS